MKGRPSGDRQNDTLAVIPLEDMLYSPSFMQKKPILDQSFSHKTWPYRS